MNSVLTFTRGTHAFQQLQPLICTKDLRNVLKSHRSPYFQSEIPSLLIHPTSRSMLLLEMGFNFGVINWSNNRFTMFYFIDNLNKCLKSILILDILFTQYSSDQDSLKNSSVQNMYDNILNVKNKDFILRLSNQFVNALKWFISLGVIPAMISTSNTTDIQSIAFTDKTYFAMLEKYQCCKILDPDKFGEIIISIRNKTSFNCTDFKNRPIDLLSFDKVWLDSIFGFTSFMGHMLENELEYIYGQRIQREYSLINQTRTVLIVQSENNIKEKKDKPVTQIINKEQQIKKNNDVLEINLRQDDTPNCDDYQQIMNEIYILQKNVQNQKSGVIIPGVPEHIPSASQYIDPIQRYGALSDPIKEQNDISARILEHEKLKDRVKKAETESFVFKKKALFLERDLYDNLQRYNDLMNMYNTSEINIRALKEKDKKTKKQGKQIKTYNEQLQKQLEKSNSVIRQLMDQNQMQEDEKKKFMHLFLNTSFDADELIRNATREDLINSFIGTLNVSSTQKSTKDLTIDQLLLQNKIIPQPIFLHVKSQHNLMIRNSWLPAEWMEDKPINICQSSKEDNTLQSSKNIIESTSLFQIIDTNPVDDKSINSSGNKRFMAIQHPQDINLKEMHETLKNKWMENIKIFLVLKDDLYTIHGQKFHPVLTESTINKFIMSFLHELFYPYFTFKYCDQSISLLLSYYYENGKHNIPSIYETISLFYEKFIHLEKLD